MTLTRLRFKTGPEEFCIGVCVDDQDGKTWVVAGFVEDSIGYGKVDYREVLTEDFEDSAEPADPELVSAVLRIYKEAGYQHG